MSEIFSAEWLSITIVAALVGGWAFRVADRLVIIPTSWLDKKRKIRRRKYVSFISELSTNQNMWAHSRNGDLGTTRACGR